MISFAFGIQKERNHHFLFSFKIVGKEKWKAERPPPSPHLRGLCGSVTGEGPEDTQKIPVRAPWV